VSPTGEEIQALIGEAIDDLLTASARAAGVRREVRNMDEDEISGSSRILYTGDHGRRSASANVIAEWIRA
jgi:hypothetical protein